MKVGATVGSDDSGEYQYEIIAYTDIWGEHQTPEESPWNFPVEERELVNIDYAVIGITFPNGDVEYRTFANGHWDSFDELEYDVAEWLEDGS